MVGWMLERRRRRRGGGRAASVMKTNWIFSTSINMVGVVSRLLVQFRFDSFPRWIASRAEKSEICSTSNHHRNYHKLTHSTWVWLHPNDNSLSNANFRAFCLPLAATAVDSKWIVERVCVALTPTPSALITRRARSVQGVWWKEKRNNEW